MTVLEVQNLRKHYGSIEAVKGISFSVRRGEKFVFVGPNGAGKSTTISILSALLQQDEGEVRYGKYLLGRDNDAIRREIGVVFQHPVLDDDLTVQENLLIRGSLYGKSRSEVASRAKQVQETLQLGDYVSQRYGKLSGGQRRRADIARALMNEPSILFLDEPTTGLDPQTRRLVWETIQRIQKELDMTVFLTTHYMEETEDADNVLLIDHGAIVAEGTPVRLKERYAPLVLRLHAAEADPLREKLQAAGFKGTVQRGILSVPMNDAFEAAALAESLRGHIRTFEILGGSMDDVFLAVTGRKIRE